MNATTPKVFISYSWSCSDRVMELAERLVNDGIDVVLDKWELKEGQDKHTFMERSVTDNSITKVLMICDKSYAEKADNREGGVGEETMVISPEVYAKVTETKYIPVIFERDENGKEYLPVYLKRSIYFDLSNDDIFEKSYERLLRSLHDKPEHRKPPIGKMPEWLNEEHVSLTPIRALIKQIQALDGKNQAKQRHLITKFDDEFIKILNELAPINDADFDDNLLKQIDTAKPLRDIFLDYVETLILSGGEVGGALGDFFEQAYNRVYVVGGRSSCSENEFEFGLFLIWEIFICSTAILLHHENYTDVFNMLKRTYFLRENPLDRDTKPNSFNKLQPANRHIEYRIKPKSKEPNLYTLAGDIVVKRERQPIITQQTMANADVVLYQLSRVYDFVRDYRHWFPIIYPYLDSQCSRQQIWSKMISRKQCETLFPLFGVAELSQLIEQIKRNKPDEKVRYSGLFYVAPSILHSIELEKIGTLP
jgi:hypothetical protein